MVIRLVQPRADQPSFDILNDGENIGLLSQNPNDPRDANPGMWGFTLNTEDGGLVAFSGFDGFESAKRAVEIAAELKLTYAEWLNRWLAAEALGYTDITWAEQAFSANLK